MIERSILDGDGFGNAGYRVIEIHTDNNTITHLHITNNKGVELLNYNNSPVINNSNKQQYSFKGVKTPYNKSNTNITSTTNTNYEDILRKKCFSLKQSNNSEEEITKFFNYYKQAIDKGWKGNKFDVDTLWQRWIDRIN
jgi:hypothetical protein